MAGLTPTQPSLQLKRDVLTEDPELLAIPSGTAECKAPQTDLAAAPQNRAPEDTTPGDDRALGATTPGRPYLPRVFPRARTGSLGNSTLPPRSPSQPAPPSPTLATLGIRCFPAAVEAAMSPEPTAADRRVNARILLLRFADRGI